MALIPLGYCNIGAGILVDIDYNTVTKEVIDHTMSFEPCSDGLAADTLLLTDDDGYKVYVQNSTPFAYVQPPLECNVGITSVSEANSTTNQSNDGSVNISATGSGPLQYSLNNINWQSSPNFTGLAPGAYTAYVRTRPTISSEYCYDSEAFSIGYDDVVCELEIGNVSTIAPTTDSSNDGSIIINTVVDPIGLALQYKIGSGSWTSNPIFANLDEGVYTIRVRYTAFPACEDTREITLSTAYSCDLLLTGASVVHEQTRYGDDGLIAASATSTAGGIQFRINGGAYQSSGTFPSLSPGTYLVEAKDANDCTDSRTVTVDRFKRPYFDWPQVNSLRAVPLTGAFLTSALQNFDNTLFRDMRFPGVQVCNYRQKVTPEDNHVLQFRSSYQTNTLRVYNSSNVLQKTIVATKELDYLNQQDERSGSFADAGAGEVQLFFSEGIPDFYEVGMDITITEQAGLNGTYEITDMRAGTLEALGYPVLIFSKVWPGGTLLGGTVTVDYASEEFDVYQVAINMADLSNGNYYAVLTGTDDQLGTYTAELEPFTVATSWPDTLKIDYQNNDDAFKVVYSTGITHRIRVEGELIWPLPGGSRTVDRDSTNRLRKIAENVTRQPQVFVYDLPPYLLEKIALAFGHDYFTVEDVEYQTEEDFKPDYFRNDAYGNGSCKLEDVNFLADNADDEGDVDNNILLDINNTLMRLNP